MTSLLDAWHPYTPTEQDPWDLAKAAHLYRRTCFGAPWDVLQGALKKQPQDVVTSIFNEHRDRIHSDRDLATIARLAVSGGNDQRLQAWWVMRMLSSPTPIQEHITLFWHNHFATSQDKVQDLGLMHRQNELLREHSLKKFWDNDDGGFLLAISRDAAMLKWLDSNSNRRIAPNENYARELMELFALGIGNYTENDVQEAARAFTGWFVRNNRFRFVSSEHDHLAKTVLGERGRLGGEEVVRIVASQPAMAQFITRKMYRYLANEIDNPEDELIASLANKWREKEYDIQWLVETILRSRHFFSEACYRKKISSPIEFLLGTVTRLEARQISPIWVAQTSAQLGQELFHPPNVAGWEGERAWINTSTMIVRSNVSEVIANQDGPFSNRLDLGSLATRHGFQTNQKQVDFFVDLLLDGQIDVGTKEQIQNIAAQSEELNLSQLVQLLFNVPHYQLI